MADNAAAQRLQVLLADIPETRILAGESGLCEVASSADSNTVMAAIVGAAGLAPTLAAVRAGEASSSCQQRSLGDVR